MESDTASEALVLIKERLHLVGVSREDDDDLVTVVLHKLRDRIDRLRAVCVASVNERICLVYKQHAAFSRTELLLDDLGSPADVFADEILTSALDVFTGLDDFLVLKDLSDKPCDTCLGGTRSSGKDHVKRRARDIKAHAFPYASYLACRDHLIDNGFDLGKAHHPLQALVRLALDLRDLNLIGLLGLICFIYMILKTVAVPRVIRVEDIRDGIRVELGKILKRFLFIFDFEINPGSKPEKIVLRIFISTGAFRDLNDISFGRDIAYGIAVLHGLSRKLDEDKERILLAVA